MADRQLESSLKSPMTDETDQLMWEPASLNQTLMFAEGRASNME